MEKLYGYDIETAEKTEILDWVNSNISVSEITDIIYADENEITISGLACSMSDCLKNQVVLLNKKTASIQ